MRRRALVIGYGNVLRSDDGVGRHAAERMADDPRFDGVTVIARHQLTPELALDVSRAARVVFVDASRGPRAGTFTVEQVASSEAAATASSHQLGPSGLVELARELYGRVPDVAIVNVGVASLAYGDRLSPMVDAVLPQLVDAVAELVAHRVVQRGTIPLVDQARA
jgi:hydrogenase maturation protease